MTTCAALRHDRSIAALQQPGEPASSVVAIADDGTVLEIDLTDGAVTEALTIDGGTPLPPIVHEGCIYAVTLTPSPVFHFCGERRPLDGAGEELRLRLVNNWVWVNDVNQGRIWFVTLDDLELQQISDWSSALPPGGGGRPGPTATPAASSRTGSPPTGSCRTS